MENKSNKKRIQIEAENVKKDSNRVEKIEGEMERPSME